MTTIVLALVLTGQKLKHDFLDDAPVLKHQAAPAPVPSEPYPVRVLPPLRVEVVTPAPSQATLEQLEAVKRRLDAAQKELEGKQSALTELDALREALAAARKADEGHKDEAGRLKQSVADLEAKVKELSEKRPAISDSRHGSGGTGLCDLVPDVPVKNADGKYELKDSSGKTWTNPDAEWLADWVAAVDLRLKRGSSLLPAFGGVTPPPAARRPAAVAPANYLVPQSALQVGTCTTGNCGQGAQWYWPGR